MTSELEMVNGGKNRGIFKCIKELIVIQTILFTLKADIW